LTDSETFLKVETVTQQANQSCVIACLLIGYRCITKEPFDLTIAEKEIYTSSFDLYPESLVLSHAVGFIRHFNDVKVHLWVDSPRLCNFLQQLNKEQRIGVFKKEITTTWIKNLLMKSNSPILVYVDGLYLWYPRHLSIEDLFHAPHFICVYSYTPNAFGIIDTAYGEKRELTEKMLAECIFGLKYQMLWSPIAITLEK
jgi:hypothetical protein